MSGVTPSRQVAFRVVRRVFEEGAYADRALHGEARDLDDRDRAFAMQLAFGTVQRRATLDHVIETLARPVDQLDAQTVAALRLGLYQLVFLDRVGSHAAVHESVELAKGGRGKGHTLVNAVLRRAVREPPVLPDDDTPENAALAHSYPRWIVDAWWEAYGAEEARALLRRGNEGSELALRANALVAGRDAVAEGLGVPWHACGDDLPEALVVDGALDTHGHPLWKQGAFTAQSRASMMVARTLDPQPGEQVLDLCAAPGGKTTHLAALMRGAGRIVAVERHPGRARALERTCRRMHADAMVEVCVGDAAEFPAERRFDRVLVDPPCSGLGTLQGHPDLRWRTSPEAVERLTRAQAAILRAGARAVKPGGTLVYSTCTLSIPENQAVVAAAGLEVLSERQVLPHRDRTEGFYIARLSA